MTTPATPRSTTIHTARRSATALPSADAVFADLLRRERRRRAVTGSLLAGGVLLAMLGPVCVAGILWTGRFRQSPFLADWSYPALLALATVLVVPLLFLLERRDGGRYADQAAERIADVPFIARRGAVGMLVVEVWLWGPRMILAAAARARTARVGRDANPAVAAKIVARLLTFDGGMPPVTALRGSTNPGRSRPRVPRRQRVDRHRVRRQPRVGRSNARKVLVRRGVVRSPPDRTAPPRVNQLGRASGASNNRPRGRSRGAGVVLN